MADAPDGNLPTDRAVDDLLSAGDINEIATHVNRQFIKEIKPDGVGFITPGEHGSTLNLSGISKLNGTVQAILVVDGVPDVYTISATAVSAGGSSGSGSGSGSGG